MGTQNQEAADTPWTGRVVLVTGAGGFLGWHLCHLLAARGAQVHGIVRDSPAPPVITPHRVDMTRYGDWQRVFHSVRPELVFHLAAPVDLDRSCRAFSRLRAGILDATHHVALTCLDAGTRMVHASTCEVYGTHSPPFSEDLPPLPVSAYSALKASASSWLLTLHRLHGLRVTIVRPFLTYGPGQRAGPLVANAVRAALARTPLNITSGGHTREFNYVADTVAGIASAASVRAVGRVVNIGGGPELRVQDMAREVFSLAGADPGLVRVGALPRRKGEPERFFGDHSLARRLLGHEPRVDLHQGLMLTIQAARRRARSSGHG